MILPSPAPLSPWQRFYGAAHALRRRWYRSRARRLPRPVISIGNLHWGGTGKTPLTAAIAVHLRDRARPVPAAGRGPDSVPAESIPADRRGSASVAAAGPGLPSIPADRRGLRVAILSRGYRGEGNGVRLVSTYDEGPLLPPRVAGDEPVLLAGELPGVAVVVEADRHRAGEAALRSLAPPPDLFLLDDGFSHLKLARDLDLLAFPAADPLGGGRLPPGGRLREPLASAARAHAALLTGFGVDAGQAAELRQALAPHGFRGPAFAAPIRALPPRWVAGGSGGSGPGAAPEAGPLDAGTGVLLVAGIARPEGLRRAAEEAGLRIAGERFYPDHHPYPERSLGEIAEAFRSSGAEAVLTTTKDRVKLLGRLDAPLAELPVRAEPEPAFWAWLDSEVDALLERRASQEGEVRR